LIKNILISVPAAAITLKVIKNDLGINELANLLKLPSNSLIINGIEALP
jgi:hypothetical protein